MGFLNILYFTLVACPRSSCFSCSCSFSFLKFYSCCYFVTLGILISLMWFVFVLTGSNLFFLFTVASLVLIVFLFFYNFLFLLFLYFSFFFFFFLFFLFFSRLHNFILCGYHCTCRCVMYMLVPLGSWVGVYVDTSWVLGKCICWYLRVLVRCIC